MKGYVQNLGNSAYFVLQRQVPPLGKVKLEEAFKVVGKKSDLTEEQVVEFVQFLREKVLLRGDWGYFNADGSQLGAVSKESKPPRAKRSSQNNTSSKQEEDAKGAGRNLRRDQEVPRGAAEVTPSSIIEAPYEDARSMIDRTRDRVVLKKALSLTKHFSGKEQHMRHILKRLEQTV